MTLSSKSIYASQNGDTWQLVRDGGTGRAFVRHKANQPSGGQVTEIDVKDFLSQNGPGPEYAALRDLLAKAGKDDALPKTEMPGLQ